MTELKDKLKIVNESGLNIYMMLNLFKKRSKLKPDIPEEVIEAVCDEYLKRGKDIDHTFPYFLRVLEMKSGEYFAKKNQKKDDRVNTQLIKNIFGRV